ncbi:nitrite reductase [Balneatrix alpica]|uniref:Cytochrome D1 domain-containing protein n=1 Tax=Balneatrix alpica TaxID=75684 RepID=A0ABV5ZCA4_9GAMM|nr:nitrite reductase [Balneatrix alpica]
MKTLLAVLLGLALSLSAQASQETQALYQQHCASCHNPERLGAMGPALLPENLGRIKVKQIEAVIRQGRPASQMPGFAALLNDEQIQALAEWILTPPPQPPKWGLQDILASHLQPYPPGSLGDEPLFQADLQNLFIVVELGDHHVTLLDGDRFEPIHRFKSRFALHGGPKYSPDGRYVYFASRDGWISKFDIYNLKTVAEVRAGINTRNLAVSADGRYVLVGNYLPHSLVLLDAATLKPIQYEQVQDARGQSSRVSAVYTAPNRQSFMVALKDVAEVWELNYAAPNPLTYLGPMHGVSQLQGQQATLHPLAIRRLAVNDYLDDFLFDQDYRLLIGSSRPLPGQSQHPGTLVLDLDSGQELARLNLKGLPHLASGTSWDYQGRKVLATPNLQQASVSIIDMQSWQEIKQIKTDGPGFFMRSHENSRYAWVDVFFGEHKDAVHVIDKQSLEIVKTLRPAPGQTAAHVEFSKDGRYALLSIWEMDGALVVYDANTLQEVKRLPMVKPSGKYNVYNKTHYKEGTSH